MKISPMPLVRIVLPLVIFPVVPGLLPAQTHGKAHPATPAQQRGATRNLACDGFFHQPSIVHGLSLSDNGAYMSNNKVTLLPSPSPSDPGYGTKSEQLLSKMSWIKASDLPPTTHSRFSVGTGVRITQHNGTVCPLSLRGPTSPLPFQVIAKPSGQGTQSGKKFPNGNYPTSKWPTGRYRVYHIRYSIAPKDIKLYTQEFTENGATSTTNNQTDTVPVYIPYHYYMAFGVGFLEFTTELYSNNGTLLNTTDATVLIRVTPGKAKRMLESGVGLDQTIAVPASGTYRLRAIVTDPASKRGSQSELTLDAANPKLVETAPVRPTPTPK